jgi:hypothetical protein
MNADVALPFIDVQRVSGLDAPPYRETSRDTEGQDGGSVDAEFMSLRTIVVEGTLYAAIDSVDATLDALKGNFAPSRVSKPFYFKHPNIPQRLVNAKPLGVRYDVDALRRLGSSPIQAQLKAGDPRQYSSDPTVLGTGPTSLTGGRTYTRSYNRAYGAGAASGTLSFDNDGNAYAPAVFVITGPIIDPEISSDEQGKSLSFNITIDGSDTLTVDLLRRTVVLNGTANRRNTLTFDSTWFLLQPGVNTIRFGGTPNAGAPTISMTSRSAWV